jgi:hypothetical protein
VCRHIISCFPQWDTQKSFCTVQKKFEALFKDESLEYKCIPVHVSINGKGDRVNALKFNEYRIRYPIGQTGIL